MGDTDIMQGNLSKHHTPFTHKGRMLNVKNKKGKEVQGKVLRCQGDFADVNIGWKTFLVDSNLRVWQ